MFLCEAAFEEGRDDAITGVHLTGKRAGQAAAEAGVERLLLTHIPVWTDINTVVNEAKEVYSGGIAVAVSGVTYGVFSGSQLGTPEVAAHRAGLHRALGAVPRVARNQDDVAPSSKSAGSVARTGGGSGRAAPGFRHRSHRFAPRTCRTAVPARLDLRP